MTRARTRLRAWGTLRLSSGDDAGSTGQVHAAAFPVREGGLQEAQRLLQGLQALPARARLRLHAGKRGKAPPYHGDCLTV